MNEPILFLVSRGLLDHKPRMGPAIWEYLWFIDRVTKDEPDGKGKFNGLVLGGQPVSAASIARDLNEHVNTAKMNIKALEVEGYIVRRRRPDNRCSYVVTNSKKWFWSRTDLRASTGTENSPGAATTNTEDCASPVHRTVPAGTENCASNKERHDSDKTETKPKRRSGGDPSLLELPSWLRRESWTDWCQHRREMRRPLTEIAAKKSISCLDRYRVDGHSPERVIDHSITNGWQGLYPPREKAMMEPMLPATSPPIEVAPSPSARMRQQLEATAPRLGDFK
jgi:hypothetical protein